MLNYLTGNINIKTSQCMLAETVVQAKQTAKPFEETQNSRLS
jgi:hypothetical protein